MTAARSCPRRRLRAAAVFLAATSVAAFLLACGDEAGTPAPEPPLTVEATQGAPGASPPPGEAAPVTPSVTPAARASPAASATAGAAASPAVPAGAADPSLWGRALVLGMADRPRGAGALAGEGIASARYQYLSGGVGDGWTTWAGGGAFVRDYVRESEQAGLVPVFTYYMLVQSAPDGVAERDRPFAALADPATVGAYFRELEEFFRAAGESGSTVVLHLEPDTWGFAQQSAGTPSRVPVALEGARAVVGDGYPGDLRGFAQAVFALRDRLAPNVQVAYHLSHWAGGQDPMRSNASGGRVDSLAQATAEFYRSLEAPFDLTFTDVADRDAGFLQDVYGMGDEAWWDEADFERHARLLGGFSRATGQRLVLWQVPYGNTRMRAMDNTWNHYQDNRVEWFLDDPSRAHLARYVEAGVIALLFGRGADGATDASDANGDGVTDPPPLRGNDRTSLSADDDGGFFREHAAEYYRRGVMPLP